MTTNLAEVWFCLFGTVLSLKIVDKVYWIVCLLLQRSDAVSEYVLKRKDSACCCVCKITFFGHTSGGPTRYNVLDLTLIVSRIVHLILVKWHTYLSYRTSYPFCFWLSSKLDAHAGAEDMVFTFCVCGWKYVAELFQCSLTKGRVIHV